MNKKRSPIFTTKQVPKAVETKSRQMFLCEQICESMASALVDLESLEIPVTEVHREIEGAMLSQAFRSLQFKFKEAGYIK